MGEEISAGDLINKTHIKNRGAVSYSYHDQQNLPRAAQNSAEFKKCFFKR